MTSSGVIAPRRLLDAPSAALELPWDAETGGENGLTHAMMIAWFSRPDLQELFNIGSPEGRLRLRQWYREERNGRRFLQRLSRLASALARQLVHSKPGEHLAGVNLIGYAQGVLGMGEHVRMSAAAMRAAQVPNGIVDFTLGLGPRRQPLEGHIRTFRWPRYRCNLFHINADQMVRAYLHLGQAFFAGRYNIGYWAWELAKWPHEWWAVIGIVDEIWAPSRFIREALARVTCKPIHWMPLCIELQRFTKLPRSEFGVSDDDYLFLFSFDCHSYVERKNPLAVVRAFRAAFPDLERARLIIKTMNTEVCPEGWQELKTAMATDDRIRLIDGVWSREKMLALVDSCDAYVSLHRSEGFGRGPAEAMLLGKPVIATDYSGTADFCSKDNALLVDYNLVDVAAGSYVGAAGQIWADPHIECAAKHMRALFEDRSLGPRVGAKGRQTISQEFSAVAVGQRYHARLLELGMV